jgi:hypothetical protein
MAGNVLHHEVIMNMAKGHWILRLFMATGFFLVALLAHAPPNALLLAWRILMLPVCAFAILVFATAIVTNKYE